jgi:hypothetical protein
VLKAVTPYKGPDGKTYTGKWVDGPTAVTSPALGAEGLKLAELTHSNMPIVHHGWLLRMASTTVDGGIYYDLRGIRGLNQAKYLASRGISEKQVEELGSGDRVAVFRSGVTGKPRRVDLLRGAGVRVSRGTGLAAITHDVRDKDIDPEKDLTRNLLDAQDFAREVIVETASGFHEYSLWNAQGVLQDEVPPDVASDHLIPAPHTKRLQPAIGCIRCHGEQDGWKPLQNDIQAMLNQTGVTVAADAGKGDQFTNLRKLSSLYSGDLTLPLMLGRNSYSSVVGRVTKFKDVNPVQLASKQVAATFNQYTYELVTPRTFAQLVGYKVPENNASELLAKIFPAVPGSVEDPTIAALKSGIGVNWFQAEHALQSSLLRAQAYEASQAVKAEGET